MRVTNKAVKHFLPSFIYSENVMGASLLSSGRKIAPFRPSCNTNLWTERAVVKGEETQRRVESERVINDS